MYGTGIVELRKIAENPWKAKYQSNYGVYTIKITTDGERTVKFSCSCPSDYYPNSAADFLVAENEIERLLHYVEKYLSMDGFERYYRVFASDYPEKPPEMFKKVIVPYATNTGRGYYKHILSLLNKMSQIKGGKEAA